MFQQHKYVKLSCSDDCRIWRYMDFTKFVAMLENGGLWFSRADCFTDPFDSELPNPVITGMKNRWKQARKTAKNSDLDAKYKEIWLGQIDGGRKFQSTVRRRY